MIYVLTYLAAIVAANLIITTLGPSASVVTAFVLIGLDLSLRDRLHDAWSHDGIMWKMGSLIGAGSLITYILNADAGPIALASVVAFAVAMTGDALVYQKLRGRSFLFRANGSNIVGAGLDSAIFPTMAFGVFMPWIILGQFAAKVFGGALWALVIDRFRKRHLAPALLLVALCVPSQAQPQTTVLLSSHYDVARQAPIASVVYQKPVTDRVFVNGFVETWYNTDLGYPQEKWTVFSKHWISYALTRRLSTSIEVELLHNRPGVAMKWPREMTFQPEKTYVIPKVGFTYRVK